ncbi:Trehalose transport system permease protein SugB [Austwickia sp. TVS 96-490-7B]|uniref:carbohydrate ABC transporter permease n=1 Tax=Austwickia sp. TVS 96-490-7B TaxID=2830843 RepID=UPI001C580C64|nr:carbohydrate ABC transporter permease [Austwickia sp. TVS 96-490-7B]MBW3085871.1 Trehalose transport system permease protein SugB [Austwickia sp. TVS 96-490-7B]
MPPATTSSTRVWLALTSLIVIIVTVIPLLWIFSLSVKSKEAQINPELNMLGNFLPTAEGFSWDNYRLILTGGAHDLFMPALVNSLIICLGATILAVALATLCAYAIARLDFPGKRAILVTSLAVSFFPAISLVTPLFEVWTRVGLFDTRIGLMIPYLALTLPLAIWILSAFFQQIPWEMEQAAQVDGATNWQAFRKVIVPLAAPGVFTTAIITFFTAWNDFVFAITLSGDHARTVPAALAFFTGASQFDQPFGAIAAAAVIVTIPVVVLVLLFQKRIVSGLTAGAVKG